MPSRYRRDAPRLKAEIVARVDTGETLRAVCAAPDMPSAATVRNWARADGLFAEGLAAATRRDSQIGGHGRARRRGFDQALADRIIVGLHKAIPEGITLEEVLRADPELPCWETTMRWRREEPEFDAVMRMMIAARRRMVRSVPEPIAEEVVDHIVEGGSFLSFTRLPGAPSYGTLRRWMRDPDFADAVAEACEFREDWYDDQIAMVAERTPPGPVRQMERAIGPLKRQLVRLRNRPKPPSPRPLGEDRYPSTGIHHSTQALARSGWKSSG
jgi:hypothetical protein